MVVVKCRWKNFSSGIPSRTAAVTLGQLAAASDIPKEKKKGFAHFALPSFEPETIFVSHLLPLCLKLTWRSLQETDAALRRAKKELSEISIWSQNMLFKNKKDVLKVWYLVVVEKTTGFTVSLWHMLQVHACATIPDSSCRVVICLDTFFGLFLKFYLCCFLPFSCFCFSLLPCFSAFCFSAFPLFCFSSAFLLLSNMISMTKKLYTALVLSHVLLCFVALPLYFMHSSSCVKLLTEVPETTMEPTAMTTTSLQRGSNSGAKKQPKTTRPTRTVTTTTTFQLCVIPKCSSY